MSGRILKFGGAAAAGGAAYYFYKAGGSPKVAEKEFEHDAARLSANVKSHLPGAEKEAKTAAKKYGTEAGKQFDQVVANARDQTSKVDHKLEDYRQGAENKINTARRESETKLMGAVDKFDHKVEEGASKSKSWLGGWFGGK
ncbi:hypothetical protein P152DRAFT_458666 [Eremomyces bilateralis CBS 781.70]|uniref:Calcofluor white hypersensitive protein n=1 Tax=Eremomyces bilateralis CBS 781.70 TaxID=1392243 RepID=A0A6G1G2N5_9PEZI|nr:uncharacterized protein P152DRAFT_458666 [Eremomyces bilateralis CBS 781.70]KAF1812278.1 hypothetical protein P152DRAFT_458666 [Eremomyces bilateralis CBS 781.70]